jgi:hypothetical protein
VKLTEGAALFSDLPNKVDALAPELKGLTAFRFNSDGQRKDATAIAFEHDRPAILLVGYFRDDQKKYAGRPTLETDASANDYGQAESVLTHAIRIEGLPLADVYAYHFAAGKHRLLLPKGHLLVLGFVDGDGASLPALHAAGKAHNAGLAGNEETMDWMFF